MVFFAVKKLLNLIRSLLLIFVVIFITLECGSKKILLRFVIESSTNIFLWEFYSLWRYTQVFNPSWVPLLCAIIVIQITSLYSVSSSVQFYNYCFMPLSFHQEKKVYQNTYSVLHIFFYWCSLFPCVNSSQHLVSFHFSLKESVIFLVGQIC